MEQKTLAVFIAERIKERATKDSVKEQLTAVGWSEEEVDAAYAEALVASGVPVPNAGGRGRVTRRASTVEIVLNFFSFILLGIVVTALGVLYFQIINRYFPDALAARDVYNPGNFASDAVHYAMAALIIGFPLYYAAVRLWFKRFREDEAKVESRLTKWVTYLVLLAASVTIVGDLITVVFTFLQGEITIRFFLKALTILAIAAMVFTFYYLERRKVQYGHDVPRRTFQMFGWILTALGLVGILLGFLAAGSPAAERARTFDAQRANDLSSMANCINSYAEQFQRLPDTLDTLGQSSSFSYCALMRDPETNAPYEYHIVAPLATTTENVLQGTYELCATFSTASDPSIQGATTPTYYGMSDTKWSDHPAGRACDNETVSVRAALPVPPAK
jgi:membrane protein YqaA with SNARE-associated domain